MDEFSLTVLAVEMNNQATKGCLELVAADLLSRLHLVQLRSFSPLQSRLHLVQFRSFSPLQLSCHVATEHDAPSGCLVASSSILARVLRWVRRREAPAPQLSLKLVLSLPWASARVGRAASTCTHIQVT